MATLVILGILILLQFKENTSILGQVSEIFEKEKYIYMKFFYPTNWLFLAAFINIIAVIYQLIYLKSFYYRI